MAAWKYTGPLRPPSEVNCALHASTVRPDGVTTGCISALKAGLERIVSVARNVRFPRGLKRVRTIPRASQLTSTSPRSPIPAATPRMRPVASRRGLPNPLPARRSAT